MEHLWELCERKYSGFLDAMQKVHWKSIGLGVYVLTENSSLIIAHRIPGNKFPNCLRTYLWFVEVFS